MLTTETMANGKMWPFYIAGCQRSGTTLMRLILETHSEVYCFDEEEGYPILVCSDPDVIKKCLDQVHHRYICFKIPRYTEQLLDEYVDDPRYGVSRNFYSRNNPLIFMLRDVLDVVASMYALRHSSGRNWLAMYGVPILKHKMSSPIFGVRYAKDIKIVIEHDFAEHLVGALYWKYKTDGFFDYLEAGLRVFGLRYEDLVHDPETKLKEVTNFVGLRWENSLLNHHRVDHRELDKEGKAIGGTDPKEPINNRSVQRHLQLQLFSHQQRNDILDVAGRTCEAVANLSHRGGQP